MSEMPSPNRSAHRRRWPARSRKLTGRLCPMLERRGLGARRLDLLFERVDGRVEAIRIGTARPVRNPQRLTRLLSDRLETVDPGFGIEAMTLIASLAEPLAYSQAQPARRGRPSRICRRWSIGSRTVSVPAGSIGSSRSRATFPSARSGSVAPLAPPACASWPEHWPRPAGCCRRPSRSRPSRCCRIIRRRSSPGAASAGGSGGPTGRSGSSANGGGTTAKLVAVRDYFQRRGRGRRALLAVPQRRRRGRRRPARSAGSCTACSDDRPSRTAMPNCRSRRISRSCAARRARRGAVRRRPPCSGSRRSASPTATRWPASSGRTRRPR